jgi:hypothetical protein
VGPGILEALWPKKIIFNVGGNDQNFQKFQIGQLIKERLPQTKPILRYDKGDPISYRVDLGKLSNMTGFKCIHRPKQEYQDWKAN